MSQNQNLESISTDVTIRWANFNGLVMLGAFAASFLLKKPLVLSAGGLLSIGFFIYKSKQNWTPAGNFGVANILTAFRWILVLIIPIIPVMIHQPDIITGWIILSVSGLVLVLDGFDGWLARRYHLSSEFGEFFDKETDALLVMILAMMLFILGRLPMWILITGLLRYIFVLTLWLIPPANIKKEPRSKFSRYIFVLVVAGLLTSFSPFKFIYIPLAGLSTLALLISFIRSWWWLYAGQHR